MSNSRVLKPFPRDWTWVKCLWLVACLLLSTQPSDAQPSTTAKKVLLIHADNQFQPANMVMDAEFQRRLTGEKGIQVTLYSEYLELVRFATPRLKTLKVQTLDEKFTKMGLDLVIVTDDTSWDFLANDGNTLFSGVPMVFCGITNGKIDLATLRPKTTGTFKSVDVLANLLNIHQIQPDVDQVVVILGNSRQDQFYEKIARDAASAKNFGFQIRFLVGRTIQDIEQVVGSMPSHSAVLYVSMYSDGAGKTFNPRDALDLIASKTRAPIYGVSSTYLGHGIVGGNLLSFEDLSSTASDLSIRVLHGKDPDSIAPFLSQNRNYFDWKELSRWGLKAENLPAGSIVLNQPPDPWLTYQKEILGFAVFVLLETALVGFLFYQLLMRRRDHEILRTQIEEKNSALSMLTQSDQRFHTLWDSSADAIYVVDFDGKIIRANQTTCRRLKYTNEELTAMSVFDFQAPDLVASSHEKLEAIIRDGSFLFETTHVAKDGTVIPSEVHSQIIDFEGGKRILAVARDITERIRSLLELKQSENRYRMIFENSGTANAIGNTEGVLVACNAAYAKMFNLAPEQMVNKRLVEFAGEEYGTLFHELIVETWLGKSIRREVVERTLPGTQGTRWLETFWYPLFKETSGLDGIQIVAQDITERKKLTEHLNQVQKLESIGALAGGIAHDFNNLLAGLWSNIELAQMDVKKGSFGTVSKRLEKASDVFLRAKALTGQLLTFSKGGTPVRVLQSMESLIAEWATFAMSGSTNPLNLQISVDLWHCECDSQQIGQIVDNLLINARQASPLDGTVCVEAVNVERDGRPFIKISVSDRGPGVPLAIRDRIFDPFFTTKEKGTGLGLATSASIALKHQGWLELGEGGEPGCTFSLFLPAVPHHATAPVAVRKAEFDGRGKIALIMDDEEVLRDSIGELLSELGFEVISAGNGAEAADRFTRVREKGRSVTLALLDLTIPGGVGGQEVSRSLKKRGHSFVSVAMSGYSEHIEELVTEEFGFDGYLSKPFSREQLVTLISRLMQGR